MTDVPKDNEKTNLLGAARSGDKKYGASIPSGSHKHQPSNPQKYDGEEVKESYPIYEQEAIPDHDERFRILNTKIDIVNLCAIDTATRTFRCDIEVTMDWKMTIKEQKNLLHAKEEDKLNEFLKQIEAPQLTAGNGRDLDIEIMTTPDVSVSVMKSQDKDKRYQFHSIYMFKGEWSMAVDKNELNDFPFDYESLDIFINTKTSHRDRFKIDITGFEQQHVVIRPSESQEFDCYMAEIVTYITENPTKQTYDGGLSIRIKAKRKWRYYFNQIAIFVFLLSCLVLPAYAIDVSDVADRLSHLVTVALAQTALLYFVGGSLPKLTYFSVLDEYLIWNFMFSISCAIQTAIVSLWVQDGDVSEIIDRYCFYVFIAIFVLINVWYISIAIWTSTRNWNNKYEPGLIEFGYIVDNNCFISPTKSYYEQGWNIWKGGPCVYHKHNWSKWKEKYRDWTTENEPVKSRMIILDEIVIIFGEFGAFDADNFNVKKLKNQYLTTQKALEMEQEKYGILA